MFILEWNLATQFWSSNSNFSRDVKFGWKKMHRRRRHSNLFTYCSKTIYLSYLSMFISACRVSAKCNTMQISHSQALTQYSNEAMLCSWSYSVSMLQVSQSNIVIPLFIKTWKIALFDKSNNYDIWRKE